MLAILLFWPRLREYYVSSPLLLGFRTLSKISKAAVSGNRWDRNVLEPMVFYKPKRRRFRKVKSRSLPQPSHVGCHAHRNSHPVEKEVARLRFSGAPRAKILEQLDDALFI